MQEFMSGENGVAPVANRRRFAAAWVDLYEIPVTLGIIAGLLLQALPDPLKNLLLISINIGWLLFRDAVFAPGRQFVWRRAINMVFIAFCGIGAILALISGQPEGPIIAVSAFISLIAPIFILVNDKADGTENLKLVNLEGSKVTLAQAFIRNVLLLIPFVLIVGYIVEIVYLLAKGKRLADGWAKTRVTTA